MWTRLLNAISKKGKNSSEATSIFFPSKNKALLISLTSLIPLIIIVVIVIIIMLPVLLVQQFIADASSEDPSLFKKVDETLVLNDWCTKNDNSCNKEGVQKYYERLNEVNNEYKEKGVTLDIQLLTATIFYSNTQRADLFINDEEEDEIKEGNIKLSDVNKLASNMVNGSSIDYTKYRKYLVDTFIPKRFKDLYEGKQDKEAAIKNIADEIMSFASGKGTNNSNQIIYSGSTTYTVNGLNIDVSRVPVVLTTCDGKKEIGRVDFETYVKGVVKGETYEWYADEVKKAQAIEARTYALTRNLTLCPGRPNNCEYGYNPNSNEIRLRNCEADQVYCDYKKGCQRYKDSATGYIAATMSYDIMPTNYTELESAVNPMTEEEIKKYEENLNQVTGIVIKNEKGDITSTGFDSSSQTTWQQMHLDNPSLDYNDILVKYHYNKSGANIVLSGGFTIFDGEAGEASTWKQADPRWSNVYIGPVNMGGYGCLVTSISIQFARTGTVNLPDFNPGIFANELTKRGGFDNVGNLQWLPLKNTLTDLSNGKFEAVNLDYALYGTKQNKIDTLQQFINSGYLLVVGVNWEGHWVAVNKIENNEVYIFDPAGANYQTITEGYSWEGVKKVQTYRIVP